MARLSLIEVVPPEPGSWPWATLIANVIGSAILGYAAVRLSPISTPSGLAEAVSPGFCGALTTFSTVQIEVLWMLEEGRNALAGAYLGTSVAACLVAASALAGFARGRPA